MFRTLAGSISLSLALSTILNAASVRFDFEGGSLGSNQKISETHFRLGVKGQTDQDGRNRQASWYYFEVEGAGAAELTFDMVDLPGEYNYKPNRGAINGDTPPVISYDGKTWKHLQTAEYMADEPKLRLRIKPAGSRFRIAHTPPYTSQDLKALRQDIANHPDFQEQIIGPTPDKRPMVLWTIHQGPAEGRKTVWLMFRQHSWESGSSWVGEGAVRELLSKSPASEKLRRDIVWKIFPLCDPDGVARGGVRFNSKGYDLNRNWDVLDAVNMPEITAQRAAVRDWLAAGNTIDLFLSLHNTETSEYLEGPPNQGGPFQKLAETFFRNLTEKTMFAPSRPLFYAQSTTDPGKPGRMNVLQGLHRDFKIPAFLMEQRIALHPKLKRLPEVPDRLRFGRELVGAAAAAVR